MGYDFSPQKDSTFLEPINITSGSSDIDLLAEMILHIENQDISWLANNYSQAHLVKLVKQISDRRRGKELIDELQREKDKRAVQAQNSSVKDKLRKSGFVMPEF